ncbi:hypothetical protein ABK040_009258 [Willaertia magna]
MPKYFKENQEELSKGMTQTVNRNNLTRQDLIPYFEIPIKNVAALLNISLTQFKKLCRNLGISRWPYRKIQSLKSRVTTKEIAKEKLEQLFSNKPNIKGKIQKLEEEIQELLREIEEIKNSTNHTQLVNDDNGDSCSSDSVVNGKRKNEDGSSTGQYSQLNVCLTPVNEEKKRKIEENIPVIVDSIIPTHNIQQTINNQQLIGDLSHSSLIGSAQQDNCNMQHVQLNETEALLLIIDALLANNNVNIGSDGINGFDGTITRNSESPFHNIVVSQIDQKDHNTHQRIVIDQGFSKCLRSLKDGDYTGFTK